MPFRQKNITNKKCYVVNLSHGPGPNLWSLTLQQMPIQSKRISANPKIATSIQLALYILVAIIAGSCVPSMLRSAKTPEDRSTLTKSESTLIKPKLAQQPNNSEPQKNPEGQPTEERSRNASETIEKPPLSSPERENKGLIAGEHRGSTKALSEEEKAPKRLVGSEKGNVPPESEQKKGPLPGDVKIKDNDEEEWMKSEGKPPSFKKHDHSKYIDHIRSKAIDALNREQDCSYSMLCNDSTTDEWSLTLYFKQEKSFRYKSFAWDPIDDRWEQQYESERKPLGVWKNHMGFATSGKKCHVLKGGNRN